MAKVVTREAMNAQQSANTVPKLLSAPLLEVRGPSCRLIPLRRGTLGHRFDISFPLHSCRRASAW